MKPTLLRRLTLVLGLFAILGVLAVACGGDEEEGPTPTATHTPAATHTPVVTGTPAATGTHAATGTPAATGGTPAATGAPAASLAGNWKINQVVTESPYTKVGTEVPCTASLKQTDSSVSGKMPCQGDNPLEYKITGSVDAAGKFTLTGTAHMAAVNLDVETVFTGTISADGKSISATYEIAAFQTKGTIEGTLK